MEKTLGQNSLIFRRQIGGPLFCVFNSSNLYFCFFSSQLTVYNKTSLIPLALFTLNVGFVDYLLRLSSIRYLIWILFFIQKAIFYGLILLISIKFHSFHVLELFFTLFYTLNIIFSLFLSFSFCGNSTFATKSCTYYVFSFSVIFRHFITFTTFFPIFRTSPIIRTLDTFLYLFYVSLTLYLSNFPNEYDFFAFMTIYN